MTAQYASTAAGMVRVWCDDRVCRRPLDMEVVTIGHATNLAAKHDREHHPDAAPTVPGEDPAPVASYDVSAAARVYLDARALAARGGENLAAHAAHHAALVAAGDMWRALTGLTDQEAITAAEHAANHPTTAHAAPF